MHNDALVAIVGRRRCYVLAEPDDDDLRLVLAMCLHNREVEEGRVPGPFDSASAARWAEAVLSAEGEPLKEG